MYTSAQEKEMGDQLNVFSSEILIELSPARGAYFYKKDPVRCSISKGIQRSWKEVSNSTIQSMENQSKIEIRKQDAQSVLN